MNNQTNMSGGTTKMKAKDFITLGIFTVLFFAVVMVCIFASAAIVVTFAFGCAIAALPGGIILYVDESKSTKGMERFTKRRCDWPDRIFNWCWMGGGCWLYCRSNYRRNFIQNWTI